MRFSVFIVENLDEIAQQWDAFACTLLPPDKVTTKLALRHDCREILRAIAIEMETPQTEQERFSRSRRLAQLPGSAQTAAGEHGALRRLEGFQLPQLVGEFRAMRASVLELWRHAQPANEHAASIDEVSRFNEELDQALAESVEHYSIDVAKSRDTFLAVLAHDLRSPLFAIELSTRLLAMPNLSTAAAQQAAGAIGRASKSMGRLITNLLEYTRSRLGRGVPMKLAACDLLGVCEAAVADGRALHPEQPLLLDASGDLSLLADGLRIQQVLANLLDNAVQHSDARAPVSLTAHGEKGAVVLTVAHSGNALAPDALQVIFEPWAHVPKTSAEPHDHLLSSFGLSLFIVREIVRGHHGTITAQSSLETGTLFTIRLPRPLD